MTDLEKEFGTSRVIDTPVSEVAATGAGLGAALCGYRPVVIHPRMDFMLLAVDQIVTQAANWSSMFGGSVAAPVTIRAIINRGGEQGAQHSQALHAWFAHVPGLRVVMPSTPADARDLLIASVLSNDPVLYIDDRWLYELDEELPPVRELELSEVKPVVRRRGDDVTLVSSGFSSLLATRAADALMGRGISADVIDLRVLNPIDDRAILESVRRTRRLVVIDGGYEPCGIAAEIVARVCCSLPPNTLLSSPARVTLPFAPAPTSRRLEECYYPTADSVVEQVLATV
jgi:pyruvate dehydrogenase E1 component beta subunit